MRLNTTKSISSAFIVVRSCRAIFFFHSPFGFFGGFPSLSRIRMSWLTSVSGGKDFFGLGILEFSIASLTAASSFSPRRSLAMILPSAPINMFPTPPCESKNASRRQIRQYYRSRPGASSSPPSGRIPPAPPGLLSKEKPIMANFGSLPNRSKSFQIPQFVATWLVVAKITGLSRNAAYKARKRVFQRLSELGQTYRDDGQLGERIKQALRSLPSELSSDRSRRASKRPCARYRSPCRCPILLPRKRRAGHPTPEIPDLDLIRLIGQGGLGKSGWLRIPPPAILRREDHSLAPHRGH